MNLIRSLTCASILVAGALLTPAPSARADYRSKAIELTDAIQRNFYVPQEKLYRAAIPFDGKGLPFEVMWGNGVQFSTLVGATKYEPARYKTNLYEFTQGLDRYWDKDAPIPGFDAWFSSKDNDDKYYDDNAWLVLGFAEANRVTGDAKFVDWARRTQDFVMSAEDDKLGGGLYWYQNKKNSKNTCINAPGIVGALALYDETHQKSDLDAAKRLYTWTNAHLQDSDGLFWDNIGTDGKIEKTKWTYNSALMIRANLDLGRVTKDRKYLAEARRISDASIKHWADPQSGAFADSAKFNHLLSEALIQSFEATKDIKYLNAARRNADFGYRQVRDVKDGLYFNEWNAENRPADQRKTLIENSSAARLFWLLVPYPDVEQLRAKGDEALKKGDGKTAIGWYRQAFNSTAGAAPTHKLSTTPQPTAPQT